MRIVIMLIHWPLWLKAGSRFRLMRSTVFIVWRIACLKRHSWMLIRPEYGLRQVLFPVRFGERVKKQLAQGLMLFIMRTINFIAVSKRWKMPDLNWMALRKIRLMKSWQSSLWNVIGKIRKVTIIIAIIIIGSGTWIITRKTRWELWSLR